MSLNLFDSVKAVFTNDLIGKAASYLGEDESIMSKAISAGIPTMLSGIVNNAASDGGANIMNLAKQAAGSGIMDNVGGLFSSSNSSLLGTGSSMLSGLFGNKTSMLSSLISNFSGVKSSSASSLMSLLAPVALSFIGKHALSNNLSGGGILSWLNGQKNQISAAVPSGLNLSGILDGGSHAISDTVHKAAHYVEPEKTANKWLWPVLLSLLGIGLLWYFLKGCNDTPVTPAVIDTAVIEPKVIDTPVVSTLPAAVSFKVKLPDGSELDANKGGIEDQLVTFLNDANAKPGKDVWFDFDNLNFNTSTAEILPASQQQLNNIIAILKAYPKAKIKIGGYTDKTGDEAVNKKLSQARAAAVQTALAAASVGGQVSGAEGYGSQFAKAAADAPDSERVKDRRVSVSVREK